jgi:V/A-type H+-transporting ATPase subunit A
MTEYFDQEIQKGWSTQVAMTMKILQEEAQLEEIVRLVGIDSLEFKDRLTLDCARSIREDFLHQIAFHEIDTYTSLNKQYGMLKAIITWYDKGLDALKQDYSYAQITSMKVLEKIGRMKYIRENDFAKSIEKIMAEIDREYQKLMQGGDENA